MIIKRYQEDELFRHIFWISIVYFLAHGFLLIATGLWWDDWIYADKNWEFLYEAMRQCSLPWAAYLDASLWLFPDGFYRIFVFALYYIGALFFYFIIKKVDIFRQEEYLWITLLFITIPVNDARITWICFPYAFGYCVFFIAFYVSLLWQDFNGKKRWMVRGASLMLLMVGYSFLESTMMLTVLLLAYYYYKELRENWEWSCSKKNVNSFFKAVSHYLDYLFAPIVWYFCDKLLFPGYGFYAGHSYVPWEKLPIIVFNSPKYTVATMKYILLSYNKILHWIFSHTWLGLIIVIASCWFLIKYKFNEQDEYNAMQNPFFYDCSMAFMGCILFFLGGFPYFVKFRFALENIFVWGRNCILLGIGMALLLYYGIHSFIRYNITRLVMIFVVVLGVIHFNFTYLDWQECYYQQLQFQQAIKENDNIKNNDTFLVMYRGEKACTRFYQANGNAWVVFGDQTRFFMSRYDLNYLQNAKSNNLLGSQARFFLNAFMMNNYNYGDGIIDGVIFINYKKLTRKTLIKQKWNEFFNQSEFELWINEITNVKYVPLTPADSGKILDLNSSGKLDDKIIYDMYYR